MGDCTAFYWYDAGNTIPKAAECSAAYIKILATSIGGALGYDAAGNRTNDPLYAIYPKDGNANCFKATGDTSPVLAPDAFPGGGTLPTCPVGTSRRRRALAVLEGRDQGGANDGLVECAIEDGVFGSACTVICLATVTTASWLYVSPSNDRRNPKLLMTDDIFFPKSTGPFAVAGWLACLGGCSATGTKLYNNCQKAKGNTNPDDLIPLSPFGKREGGEGGVIKLSDPCHNIKQWTFQCPAQETGLLSTYRCQQSINT